MGCIKIAFLSRRVYRLLRMSSFRMAGPGRRSHLRGPVVLALLLVLTLVSLGAPHSAKASSSGPVIVVNFDVPVDPGSSALVANAVSMAQTEGASAIVIEMNTPGGLLSDMLDIISSIQLANSSGIPTYTYVPPDGLAASAGSYIAMSTNKILMGSGSEIGPSTPIVEGGTALEQNHTEDAMIQLMVSLAQSWGRNTTAAYAMVYSDTAYSASQAYAYHLINGNASSLQDALTQFGLSSNSVVTVQEGVYDQLLSALSNTTLDGVLILVGILAIVLDLYHPTILLSIVGAIAIVAGLVGAEVVGASLLGIFVMGIGGVLVLLELRLGHGLAMMGGMAVGAIGIYLLAQGVQFSPSPINDVTEIELVCIAGVGVIGGLYVRWIVGPLRHRKNLTGPESVIGKEGKVTIPLTPDGEVSVEGINWRARSTSGNLQKGEVVKVKSIEELVLVVEKAGASS